MMETANDSFQIVGQRPAPERTARLPKKWFQGKPLISIMILAAIILGCLCAELIMTKDPTYMDLQNYNQAPNREFLFGTDTMGRDIFSMLWYGGRISLTIGVLSTFISTFLAIVIGSFCGIAPQWLDSLLMRFTEIFLSIPSLLLIILFQAVLGKANVFSLSVVIGLTSWTSIAKVVRTEVRQIRNNEYVIASRCMGGNFFHILWKHLTPNFLPSSIGIYLKFYGNWPSAGDHFLGKHAFPCRKSPPDQFLVDHPHPRNLPDNNLALYDKHWKLPAKEWKPEGK